MKRLNKDLKKEMVEYYGYLKECGLSLKDIENDFKLCYGLKDISSIRKEYDSLKRYDKLDVSVDETALEEIAKARNELLVDRKINVKQRNILNNDASVKAYRDMVVDTLKNYKWKEYKAPKKYVKKEFPLTAVYIISDEHFKGECDVMHLNKIYDEIQHDIDFECYEEVELWYLGDGVDGLIHCGSLASNDGAIQPTIQYTNILIERINKIPQIKTVRFITESNHTQTRPLNTKRNELAKEDLNYLIAATLSYGLRKDIKLIGGDVMLFKYEGMNMALLHGHQPYAKSKAKMIEYWSSKYGMVPDITIMGHYHTFKVTEFGDNKWLVVAPTAKQFNGDYERTCGFISNKQIMKMEIADKTPRFEIINIK